MTLEELIRRRRHRPQRSVPDWMLGCFRRRCISFANGESDDQTIVYWLQSCNFTIDLRLPLGARQVRAAAMEEYSEAELVELANYEGWFAGCQWNGKAMMWQEAISLQVTNRWPEPAELTRTGNCMVEFAPSGAYVEDWRMQPSDTGPLVGLRLVGETIAGTEDMMARRGGLIICGDYAAMVLGRSSPPGDVAQTDDVAQTLQQQIAAAGGNLATLKELLDFETSVAQGSLAQGYTVIHSTLPERVGSPLLEVSEFEWLESSQRVAQRFLRDGQECVRHYEVDVIEPCQTFPLTTPVSDESAAWFAREAATLQRYTGVLQ
jgi:hypothetical protein